MIKTGIFKIAIVTAALASISVAGLAGFPGEAAAKNGNGNSGGGTGGNGGGGAGKNDGAKGSSAKSNAGRPDKVASRGPIRQADKAPHTTQRSVASQLRGLNSLKRNYHAYLNASDPKLAGVAAYVQDYAQYEIKMGTAPSVDDPTLGDAALRSALSTFSKTTVTGQQLSWAKDVLGVGTTVGKIDQVRKAMVSNPDLVE